MTPLPRTAIALYVALALHVLVLLATALLRPSQDSAGAGQGLSVRTAALSPAQRQLLGARPPARSTPMPSGPVRAPASTSTAPPRRLAPSRGDAKAAPALGKTPEPAAADAPAQAGGGGRDLYFARLRAHLAGHRRALRPGLPATRSLLRVAITRDGRVEDLALVESSGLAELDEEAMDLVRRAAPLPAPPGARTVRLIVPVEIVPGG